MYSSLTEPAEPKSFRPISNLSVFCGVFSKYGTTGQHKKQLLRYLKDNDLLPDLQSVYRAHHSTETVILRVLSDILSALDSGNVVMLTLLDLSAAFDCVDHHMYAPSAVAHVVRPWREGQQLVYVVACLGDRTQQVRTATSSSMPSAVDFGVPQGSVLGPILFLLYTLPTCCSSSKVIISATRVCRRHADLWTLSAV